MKTSLHALAAAVSLAVAGAAFAAPSLPNVPANDNMQQANPKAAKNFTDLKNKTKRGASMAIDKTTRAINGGDKKSTKARSGTMTSSASGTSAMGASSDGSRQQRMDAAYANWQSAQRR